jgi:hypothetical protein
MSLLKRFTIKSPSKKSPKKSKQRTTSSVRNTRNTRSFWNSPINRNANISPPLRSPSSRYRRTTRTTKTPTRKSKQKQFNVIFDLDETLIFSMERIPSDMDIKKYVHIPIHYTYRGKYIKNNIFIRPFLFQLILVLKNIPNVNLHVWTSSEEEYAIAVVKGIETYLSFSLDLVSFISRKTIQEGYDTKYYYYNIFKNKIYSNSPYKNNFLVKDLKFLYNNSDFNGIFSEDNTVLIDDLIDNIKVNSSKNVIWINKWNKKSPLSDNSLEVISKWFMENQNVLPKLRTLSLPEFRL